MIEAPFGAAWLRRPRETDGAAVAGDAHFPAAPADVPDTLPQRRLSAFYLLHFSVIGCFMPYIGPWLASLGHDAVAIGTLLAVMAAGRVVAPPLWAWYADSRPRRLPMLRACLLIATALFAVLALLPRARLLAVAPGAFWLLAALLLGYGLFGSGVLPQFEVVTLNHPGKRTQRYSVIRLWGSIGFVLAVLLVAQCLHAASFGLYHAVAVQCVHGCFRGALQGRGQALYSSVGFGVGGALGSFGAGHV